MAAPSPLRGSSRPIVRRPSSGGDATVVVVAATSASATRRRAGVVVVVAAAVAGGGEPDRDDERHRHQPAGHGRRPDSLPTHGRSPYPAPPAPPGRPEARRTRAFASARPASATYPAAMAAGLTTRRDELIADRSLGGRALCEALTADMDQLLSGLFEEASAETQRRRRKGSVALLAVGGYGRRELAPFSDIDVILVHEKRATGIEELASALWYPLWDARLKLGHAVRSVDDHLALAADDLETATTLLSARPLAGDDELARGLITESRGRWRKNGRRWLDALRSRVVERREQAGDVAYLLEPDLKDGHGGLRDVQTVWWAGDADLLVPDEDLGVLGRCYGRLIDVRVALHRVTGRPGDVLRLEDQDAVAAELGAGSADDLMADVSATGRSIVWIADGAWRHLTRHQVGREERVAPGVVVSDRVVELADPIRHRRRPVRRAAAGPGGGPARRPDRSLDAGPDGRGDRPRRLGRPVAVRRARGARRRAPPGAPGDRRPGVAGPDRRADPAAARVVDGAQPPAAQRLPPLHRRPSPLGGGGQRGRADRPGPAPRPPPARRAVPRSRQGIARRPHRGRHGAGPRRRAATRPRRRRRRHARPPRRAPPPPARRRRAPRPQRPGDDPPRARRRRRRRDAAPPARAHGGRLAGHGPVGMGIVEGAARRRTGQADGRHARRCRPPRRRRGGPLVPRRGDAGGDGARRDERATRTGRRRRRRRHGADHGGLARPPGHARPRRRGAVAARAGRAHGVGLLGRPGGRTDGRVALPRRPAPTRGSTGGRSRTTCAGRSPASWPSRRGWPSGPRRTAAARRRRRRRPDRRRSRSTTTPPTCRR